MILRARNKMTESCVASSLAALKVLLSTSRWLVRRALATIILLSALSVEIGLCSLTPRF